MYPGDGVLTKPYADDPNRWMVFLHCIGIAYMLLGLNTVCDVYFTGALEYMVDTWKIKPDVAGATFMAAGGSAPELFTSLIGTTIAENDVGFGTIVGSAVFNVLFVIGLCGYVAVDPIALTWWPLFRDCTYYILGLSMLAICASDELIGFQEALVLFLAYFIYCTIMYFNPILEAWTDIEYINALRTMKLEEVEGEKNGGEKPHSDMSRQTSERSDRPGSKEAPRLERAESGENSSGDERRPSRRCSVNGGAHKGDHAGGKSKVRISTFLTAESKARHEERMSTTNQLGTGMGESPREEDDRAASKGSGGEQEEEEEDGDLLEMPEALKDRIIWYFSLPIYFPLYYGIPEPDSKWFLATFIVSLIWIAGFSFLLVWWTEVLGQVLGIPTIVMGFTVLAAGTSIPDAVSSVAVARQGEGDMAVSSSIGSNIFDILVGLPIPWLIKTVLIEGGGYKIRITSPFLTFYVLLLLLMVFLVVCSIHKLGWVLNKTLGAMMACLYAIFLTVSIGVELSEPDFLKF